VFLAALIVFFIIIWFSFVETKGLSLEEVTLLFDNNEATPDLFRDRISIVDDLPLQQSESKGNPRPLLCNLYPFTWLSCVSSLPSRRTYTKCIGSVY
jgi:hypothetical protein